MGGLSDFNILDEWYKAVIAAGAVLAVPAITVGNNTALICAIGLVLFGVGEFVNHPFISGIVYNELGGVAGTTQGRPRRPKPFGLTLDAVGLALLAYGLILLILKT